VKNPFSDAHEPSKGGRGAVGIAHLAESVDHRHADHFVSAANGLVKTIRAIGTDQLACAADRTVNAPMAGT
jgi:hypothetical protein